ncbi:zf-TFIIB domain-containing protein [Lysobacter sp. FW306-1B-D06B]|uniref:TFIIB-type zinc ribbon-containing protein n=1 Tax=Lysobacter sp. FW306-1B-D06B TaxID=3140250 RepID=UPI0031409398
MDCPVCRDVKLAMTDRQGIEIDYCPQCRGVWLDRGELDKLIERASDDSAPRASSRPAAPPPPPTHDPRAYGHGDQYKSDHYKYKKKKNLLGELFDF